MTEQTDVPQLTAEDIRWADIYSELTDRYHDLPSTLGVPLMAVRLLVIRHGLDSVLYHLRERGTAFIAERARQEITVRHEFVVAMMSAFPPETEEDRDGAIKELAEELAAIDCPAGGLRLLGYLDRLRERELVRHAFRTRTLH